MVPFIEHIFNKFKKVDATEWLNSLKKVTLLQREIKRLNIELDDSTTSMLKEQSSSLYISISDLIDIVGRKGFTITDLISHSRHIAELNSVMAFSTIEVYPIVEDDHVVLCPDTKSCEKHKNYGGDKIKVVTVR